MGSDMMARPLLLSFVVAAIIAMLQTGVYAKDAVHILYLTDCTMYSDWQTVGMAFSFKNSGQQGHITRVMCCTDAEKAKYNHDMLDLMPSHIAPSFAYNERTKDSYPAFNKPGAVLDFMSKGTPLADYMLVIDSDMLLRHPFRPEVYSMSRGKAISADYTYMIGCTNDLAVRHIPEIPLRNDTLAGPLHRHCDMVGGYTFMHREDLSKVAPLWLSVTEDVRQDPEAWHLSGDHYVEKGGKPWISEMYGYSFACAKSGVWHTWDTHVMHYPTYSPQGIPKLMHYGLLFEVDGYKFDKHWHYSFDVAKCPPWDLTEVKDRKGGVFAHPPRPSTLTHKEPQILYYRDLLSIETVATVNAGLCDYHLHHCPPSKQLLEECTTALSIYKEVMSELRKVEAEISSKAGGAQGAADVHPPGLVTEEMAKALEEMAKKLSGSQEEAAAPKLEKHEAVPVVSSEQAKQEVVEAAKKQEAVEAAKKQEAVDAARKQEAVDAARKEEEKRKAEVVAAMKAAVTKQSEFRKQERAKPDPADAGKPKVFRCYRMALSMEEVKECIAAVRAGQEYQRKERALKAGQATVEQADAASIQHLDAHLADPDSVPARSSQPSRIFNLVGWEAMGLWLLAIFVLIVFIPRWTARLRRRIKPAKHFE